ncbi:peptidyl-prolyl cis-trans isomerase FKBP8-like isoform X2 [Rhinatrema bivittatum]|uniref:peptidyl-prolyl cis-trans isomerase FKBP8-like isoform X2 n=1 Tax=Rhinatrema bivittatum TaxID=194408 RepID=UPI0011286751|nr:peptidyl-prolyl cis-trans isomerase FKBP8-like isoform X2 [Rhinatrema bivittatum]
MQLEEVAFLLTDVMYVSALLGREAEIPINTSLIYKVTLLAVRDSRSLGVLTALDCISLGSQKRECGNFHFEREEYESAMRSYKRALSILEIPAPATLSPEEDAELCEHRIKCLNNLAGAQMKLQLLEEAVVSCDAILMMDQDNVKALYKKGKLLSETGSLDEAISILKRALKLEPTTKAIHAELSKLVRRQKGEPGTSRPKGKPKSKALLKLGDDLKPLLPAKRQSTRKWDEN